MNPVEFAALFTYSPRGRSDLSIDSRRLRDFVKAGKPSFLSTAAVVLEGRLDAFGGFFGPAVSLVPMPRSSPLVDGALWPAGLICEALLSRGLAGDVLPCLERVEAVRKSAYAGRNRPKPAEHYETFRVAPGALPHPERVTIIDDFITKGSTLIAAAARIREAFPGAEVRGFALVRTMGLVPDVSEIIAPCAGTVSYHGGEAHRSP